MFPPNAYKDKDGEYFHRKTENVRQNRRWFIEDFDLFLVVHSDNGVLAFFVPL